MLIKFKLLLPIFCIFLIVFSMISCSVDNSIEQESALTEEEASTEPEAETEKAEKTEIEETEEMTAAESETLSLFDAEKVKNYTSVSCEKLFKFRAKDTKYQIIQGGCIIGDEFYVATTRKTNGKETARIIRLTLGGEYISESEPLELDHANNLSYNSRRSLLLVSHCQSDDGHYYRYSLVNPENFEIVATNDLPYPFFSMAYSEEKDLYASGEWSGGTLDVWDKYFNNIYRKEVATPQSLSQGVFCDGNYIYFIRSIEQGVGPEIRIYDWDLKLINVIPVDLDTRYEPESIIFKDGVAYCICNYTYGSGGFCFKLTFNSISD